MHAILLYIIYMYIIVLYAESVTQVSHSKSCTVIGASLSEPHIDETNARNPYIYIYIYIYLFYFLYGTSVTCEPP